MSKFDIKSLVFIDESGVQNNMTRFYGRAIGGERVNESVPGITWDTTTIISSIRYSGALTAMTVDGSTDAISFEVYIKNILCPTLSRNDIVIMDNLRAHKVYGIKESIEATGAKLLYLPPYSPDFNPIEKMWSKIKAYLRKVKARTEKDLEQAISDAFFSVTKSDIAGWFASCGYVLIQS